MTASTRGTGRGTGEVDVSHELLDLSPLRSLVYFDLMVRSSVEKLIEVYTIFVSFVTK